MEKIVKYGLPILVAIVLFIQLKSSHGKASSSANGISLLISLVAWSAFFVGLLIAGLIGWFVSHKSLLILTFIFSVVAFLAVFLTVPRILMRDKGNKQTQAQIDQDFESQHDKERAKEAERIARIDSLKAVFETNPNDLEAAESLGLYFAFKVEYDTAIPYLEQAVKNNSTQYLIYEKLADIYWGKQDLDKVEQFDLKVLQLEAKGKLVFEKYQHEKFVIQLEKIRKAKKE
jgi:tetratricopeptide (TPR) repeat protein